jgi:hypothetical protein
MKCPLCKNDLIEDATDCGHCGAFQNQELDWRGHLLIRLVGPIVSLILGSLCGAATGSFGIGLFVGFGSYVGLVIFASKCCKTKTVWHRKTR